MRSVSKIRHIQETNLRLEKRLIKEEGEEMGVSSMDSPMNTSKEGQMGDINAVLDFGYEQIRKYNPLGTSNKEKYAEAVNTLENEFNRTIRIMKQIL